MDNIEINNFAKRVIKERGLHSLLSSLVQEIREQRNYECFLNCATEVTKKNIFRYMFLSIPENKDSKKIEKKIISIIISHKK